MTRKGQSITLSLSEADKVNLEQLATELGMTWGEKPNISKLVKAISRNELKISANHDWSAARIQALVSAWEVLIASNHNLDAQEIARLLVERSELDSSKRYQLKDFLANPQPQWRQILALHIRDLKPFRLTFQDAFEHMCNLTVLYARMEVIDNQQYLLCHCEEWDGDLDLRELAYNRILRLDRIYDAAVSPIQKSWLSDLQTIPVTFYLKGHSAFAYEQHPDDIETELEADPPKRKVVRQVYSSFWFLRGIAPYYGDCEVISPDNVRQRHQTLIDPLSQLYD